MDDFSIFLVMCALHFIIITGGGGGLFRRGGFVESEGLLREVESSEVVSSLLSPVSAGGWIWIVRQAWTGGL